MLGGNEKRIRWKRNSCHKIWEKSKIQGGKPSMRNHLGCEDFANSEKVMESLAMFYFLTWVRDT